ncbi:hypothetical protein [Actinomadura sp. 6N118]|uniref:hypothetical protein n=1 Tax=Actinomadura sp. 6N118 TaxID=3375151 RepID=UPI00379960F0
MRTSRPAMRRHLPTSPFKRPPAPVFDEYAPGELVTHDKYGLGRVLKVEHQAVVIDFGPQKTRITEPYARLFKL